MSLQALITRGCKTDHGGIILEVTDTFVIEGVGVHLEGMTHSIIVQNVKYSLEQKHQAA